MLDFEALWLASRCPRSLDRDGRVPQAHSLDPEQVFIASQEALVAQTIQDILCPQGEGSHGNSILDHGQTLLAMELVRGLPPQGSGKHSLDQLLSMKPWHQVLPGLPLVWGPRIQVQGLILGPDVLVRHKDQWYCIFIHGSTKIKDSHVARAELSRWAFSSLGFNLAGYFLLHPGEHFTSQVQSRPQDYFVVDNLGPGVRHLRQPLSAQIPRLLGDIAEGRGCGKRTCPHCAETREVLPMFSIYQLHKGGRVVGNLEAAGFLDLEKLPQDRPDLLADLSPHHQIQIKAISSGKPQIDAKSLESFLKKLQGPLYFLDFECSTMALPLLPQTQAWEHIPFLFSLQVYEENAGNLSDVLVVHGQPGLDPRRAIAEALVAHIGPRGSVIGYGIALEKLVLGRLAKTFPDLGEELSSIRDRLVDLQRPFAEFWYYHPLQFGKTSLKKVLPLLTDHDHKKLTMKSGGEAHLQWFFLSAQAQGLDLGFPQEIRQRFSPDNVQERLAELSEYAALDARGLYYLHCALWGLLE